MEKFQANQSNFQHWSLKGFNSVACMQKNSKKFENCIGFFNQPKWKGGVCKADPDDPEGEAGLAGQLCSDKAPPDTGNGSEAAGVL